MDWFFACFGSSKYQKRRKQRNKKIQCRDQRNSSYQSVESVAPLPQDNAEKSLIPVSEIRDKPEEQLSVSTRTKVTFDSNIQTHEPVLRNGVTDFTPETEEGEKKETQEILAKSRQSQSSSKDNSITSSLESYPQNHRYQNCRDSDDECEEIDYGEIDFDDDNDEGELYKDVDGEDDRIVGLGPRISAAKMDEEVICDLEERDMKSIGSNWNAQDRSVYVRHVLNPVENITQWKAVKAKGRKPLKPQKENFTLDQEPGISLSPEIRFKEVSTFKSKSNQLKKLTHEIAADASLSNRFVSSSPTLINKTSTFGFDSVTPKRGTPQESNSLISPDDRPILGALTVAELRKFSASSSPRRSPSQSPDEMHVLGTVGTYWSHNGSAKDSGSASSFKGIPNTTSKYREDKRVHWHSTPFEMRLERALNRGAAAEAYSTHTQ